MSTFADWSALAKALCDADKEAPGPRQRLAKLLSEPARAACQAAAAGGPMPEAGQREVLHALNAVLKDRKLALLAEFALVARSEGFQDKLKDFGLPAQQKEWSDQDWRRHNRLLLDVALDGLIRSHRRRIGPDCVLFYCSSGEFLGEQSVMGQPCRGESCLAQGHPKDAGTSKDAGPVELVRVPAAALAAARPGPHAARRLEQEDGRAAQADSGAGPRSHLGRGPRSAAVREVPEARPDPGPAADADRPGPLHPLRRMRASVRGHPRRRPQPAVPRWPALRQVPGADDCRSCLDPVCMIGCPVGSIHRGDNGQIVIEDWCIGCGLCAEQCPYGSIQMHDIGIIREDARGWRDLPASAAGSARWMQRRFRDRRWLEGTGPFVNDRVFRETLAPWIKNIEAPPAVQPTLQSMRDLNLSLMAAAADEARLVGQPLCFRYSFQLSAPRRADWQLKLTVASKDTALTVWINGQELTTDEKASGGKREYWLPPKPSAKPKRETIPSPRQRPTNELSQDELKAALAAGHSAPPVVWTSPLARAGMCWRSGWRPTAARMPCFCRCGWTSSQALGGGGCRGGSDAETGDRASGGVRPVQRLARPGAGLRQRLPARRGHAHRRALRLPDALAAPLAFHAMPDSPQGLDETMQRTLAYLFAAALAALIGWCAWPRGATATAAAPPTPAAAQGLELQGVASCSCRRLPSRQRATGRERQRIHHLGGLRSTRPGLYRPAAGALLRHRAGLPSLERPGGGPAGSRCALPVLSRPARTQTAPRRPRFSARDGVGCESCHGAAQKWLAPHTGWKNLKLAEKKRTYAEHDMVWLSDVGTRARVCQVVTSAPAPRT